MELRDYLRVLPALVAIVVITALALYAAAATPTASHRAANLHRYLEAKTGGPRAGRYIHAAAHPSYIQSSAARMSSTCHRRTRILTTASKSKAL
jgi:hypothetical protein